MINTHAGYSCSILRKTTECLALRKDDNEEAQAKEERKEENKGPQLVHRARVTAH